MTWHSGQVRLTQKVVSRELSRAIKAPGVSLSNKRYDHS